MLQHKTWVIVFSLVFGANAWAWERQGHSLMCEAAAYLLSQEPGAFAIRSHAYDLGYYCNMPDFFWKRPATYTIERPEHYVDLEQYGREFAAHPEVKHAYELSRAEFQSAFPHIPPAAGGAFWRIRELYEGLQKYTDQLKALKEPTGPARQALQAKWLVAAGLVGHYVGDLSQPLHTTENHDGQMTKQEGIHGYFEGRCVDENYPKMVGEVSEQAGRKWDEFKERHAKMTVLQLIEELARESNALMPELLKIDKSHPREKISVACPAFRSLITERLARGAMVLAELCRRNLGWPFDDYRFYFFRGQAEYIMPGTIPD